MNMDALRMLRSEGLDAPIEEGWRHVQRKRATRARARRVRAVAFVAISVLCLVVLRFVWPTSRPAEVAVASALRVSGGAAIATVVEGAESPSVLALSDGSIVTLSEHSSLVPTVNDGRIFGLRLTRGTALFDVRPGGPRRWEIDAGIARVVVLGTKFSVARDGAGHVRVLVERGHVRVESAELEGTSRDLYAGDSIDVGAFVPTQAPAIVPVPPESLPVRPEVTPQASSLVAPSATTSPSAPSVAHSDDDKAVAALTWVERANQGDYRGAFADLGASAFEGEVRRANTSTRLFLLADVAKSSGHAELARAPLDRIAAEFPGDAALAAFTRGRLELDALGAPAVAATWFDRSLTLGLSSSLREAAMARKVEALNRAGDPRVSAAASAYLAAYPAGRYRDAVTVWSTSAP